ncbi:hypothetical protein DBR17_19690 [Sphingomonas sp. HMWF008]|nr:hypothetical protein DBR17_19690 [Sphingomonas sp. HMWF008]
MRDQPFDRPFFSQTLKAWSAGSNGAIVQSGLSTLSSLDSEPSLDPDVIIAHPSRSGSTLLSLLTAAMHEQSVLVSEPEIVFQLLQANLQRPLEAPDKTLRQLIRALGRRRLGTEQRFVVKLSSRASYFLALFRRAFPETPIVWVQREPAEIIESNLRRPRRALAGLDPETIARLALRDVSWAFLAANGFDDANFHVVDYRDLPSAASTRVAPLMQAQIGEDCVLRMRNVTRSHSHSGAPYLQRTPNPLPKDVQDIVSKTLNPLYAALARRVTL